MAKGLFVLVLLLLATTPVILAQEETPPNPYFSVETMTMPDGASIDKIVINGPPEPVPGFERPVALDGAIAAAGTLTEVPAYNWSFGCSATSASMIAAYYDRTDYPDMYTGPTNGGVMPMDNSAWTDWYDGYAWRHRCPLSATQNGLDGRSGRGHVDDYWVQYGSTAPDPFVTNGWAEHAYGDCTGDFMKTNQTSNYGNSDGGTSFYNFTDGSPITAADLEGYGVEDQDGGYGIKLFYESRGYTVVSMYNQYIRGYGSNPALGFTYDQYKAEIDAGRPVMIHVVGHTMVGVGYDDSVSDLMYIHDTWDYSTHTMIWGADYDGMDHTGVTIVHLAPVTYVSDQSGSWDNSTTWVGDPPMTPGPSADVTISSGDTVTLVDNSYAMTLTVESGAELDLAGNSLTVGGEVTNNGTMSQTLTVPNSTTTEFLRIQNVGGSEDKYLGVDITPSTGSMGLTTVAIRGNQVCTTDDQGDTVDRCFQITPSSSETADVRFHYLDSELDAENAATMQAWRWGGSAWAAAASTWTRNDGSPYNYCQANDMSQYGIITLASGGPTAVTAEGLATDAPRLIPVAIGLLVLALIGSGLAIRHRRRGRAS
jgi:hypothetical protein